jgi:hypothetical protein
VLGHLGSRRSSKSFAFAESSWKYQMQQLVAQLDQKSFDLAEEQKLRAVIW